MGSILSKLFGGGNNHHGNAQPPPPALPAPPASQANVSRSTSSTSKPTTPTITDGSPPPAPVKPAPINILEIEVDEEAFKETSPPVYTSTIKAHIDPSPPHPLEQYAQKTEVHLTTIDSIEAPKQQQVNSHAPIATIDSDYEEEIGLLENQEIEDAVIKIQAGVRGFLVRKQIHANKSQSPVQSKSIDDPMSMSQQQENILPPPENFDTFANLNKPSLAMPIQSKRVETPIPGSPFAQDDTDYTILDSVEPQETCEEVSMISNPEELEIFKKINEINQLLACKNEDEIEIVPEPPKTLSAQINAAFSSTSINNALNELDQTIREQEMTLPPETDDEVLVIEPAFADSVVQATNRAIDNVIDRIIPATPQSPSVIVKAPSLEEEDYPQPDSLWLSEEAAAIRIQAAFRGYEVRKSLSREASPARSFEEEQKPQEEIKIDEPELKPQVAESLMINEPSVPDIVPVAEAIIGSETEIEESEKLKQPKLEPSPELILESQTNDIDAIEALVELIPQQVQEKLISVTELSDQEIIQDPDSEKESSATEALVASEPQPKLPVAQITVEPIESQQIELPTRPLNNIAVKDGFGTIASSAEEIVVRAPPEENAPFTPILDIEKSIQELEKSFDRDLLADITSEVALFAESTGKPVEEEATSLINIEPPTPGVQLFAQAPSFLSTEPLLPSKIPVLDRANKSILKEPSSPEPHTYSSLPLPSCTSPLSDTTTSLDGNDSDDEADSNTPSPIPMRASSPSPFSKKRPRRHRGGKKK